MTDTASTITTTPEAQLKSVAHGIEDMTIRGAAIIAQAAAGALGAYARGIWAECATITIEEFQQKMDWAATTLVSTRPTAVSLPNAVRIVNRYPKTTVAEASETVIKQADEFISHSKDAARRIGQIGQKRIRNGDTIMTICNSSVAISIIMAAHNAGKNISVIACETRPRLQGHITAAQLSAAGIPVSLIVDSAARTFMKEVDLVITGADAVTITGAVVNKIGTSQLALAAHESRKNFIVAAETYKFAPATVMGDYIEIEERSANEVITPDEIKAKGLSNVTIRNPAFDVTPPEYIDLIVTEIGVFPPAMSYRIIHDHLGWDLEDTE